MSFRKFQRLCEKDQEFVLQQGLHVFHCSQAYFSEHENVSESETVHHTELQEILKEQLSRREEELVKIRETLSEAATSNTQLLLTETKRCVQEKTSQLQADLQSAREARDIALQEVKELKHKYESISKGIEFERDIFINLENILHTELNNSWNIEHIGQKHGRKGDIVLRHKDTDFLVMLDPKNHANVPKKDREKFIADVRCPENNYNVGIMLSRGKIRSTKVYEVVQDGEKILIYISHFCIGMEHWLISFIESLLQNFLGKHKNDLIDKNLLKQRLIQDFSRVRKDLRNVKAVSASLEERLKALSAEFYEYFKEDIHLQ